MNGSKDGIIQHPNELPDIVAAIAALYMKKDMPYPAKSVHASRIGWPCARELCYEQVAWDKKGKLHAELLQRFQIGNIMEKQALRDLEDALEHDGWKVIGQQCPIPPNPLNIGGKIDAQLQSPSRRLYPVEVKSVVQHTFAGMDTVEDLLNHEMVFYRLYPAQIMTYLYYTNTEWGVLLLKSLAGPYKALTVHLDMEYMEEILQKAQRVTDAINAWRAAAPDPVAQDRALPDRINYTGSVCGKCPFRSICLPDILQAPGIENLLWDVELNALCQIRLLNSDARDAFEDADDKIKAHAKAACSGVLAKGETKTLITEGFTISCKGAATTRYEMPDDVKAKYKVSGQSIRVTIEPVKE